MVALNSNKIMYFGSGLHLHPLKHFTNTTEFIFVDTQPRSEFDSPNDFYDGFFREQFYDNLVDKAKKYSFQLVNIKELDSNYFTNIMSLRQRIQWIGCIKEIFPFICPTLLIFYNYNTGQKLKYYISTNILYNMCEELENDIKTSDGLIISGYHPDSVLLEYIVSPINLYCYNQTCYKLSSDEVDNCDNLIYWSFENLNMVPMYFENIFVVNYTDGKLTKFDNLIEMNEFVLNSIEKKIEIKKV